MSARANPFVTHRPVEGEELCGREPVLRALGPLASEEEPVAVTGEPGAGFTSVAAEVARRWGEEGRSVVVVDATLAGDGPEVADGVEHRWASGGRPERWTLLLDGLGRLGDLPDPESTPDRRPADSPPDLVIGLGPGAEAAVRGWTGTEPNVVDLGRIPLAAWLPYVLERFLETGRWIGDDHVAACVERSGGHPARTPALLAEVWSRTERGRVDAGTVEAAWEALLGRARPEMLALLAGLTVNQRRVLRGLALEGAGGGEVKPYSSEFLDRHRLPSPSSVQRCVQSLEERWHVTGNDAGPRVRDPLLAAWLRRQAERDGGANRRADRWSRKADR